MTGKLGPDLQRRKVDKWYDLLVKFAVLIVICTFVLVIALQIQVQRRNEAIDRLDRASADATVAAQEAKAASERASAELAAVISNVQSPDQVAQIQRSRESIQTTREAVARIEAQLCGGPCPTERR